MLDKDALEEVKKLMVHWPVWSDVEEDKIFKAIPLLVAEVERYQWQPIETAVEDETDRLFLARHRQTGNVFPVVGCYSAAHQDWSVHVDLDAVVTHWAPIPAPPVMHSGGSNAKASDV